MAYLQKTNGKWRVQIEIGGVRTSRTFHSEEEARTWAVTKETSIRERTSFREAMMFHTISAHVPRRILEAAAKIPVTKEELLKRAFPVDLFCGVYFLIEADEVVYIGQSVDVMSRISRHRREGKEFDSFNVIPCTRDRLDEVEGMYIDAFAPWLNHTLGKRA